MVGCRENQKPAPELKLLAQKSKKAPKRECLTQNTHFGARYPGYLSFRLFWNTVCQIQIILQLLKKFVLIWNTLKLLP
jgi:hypothetical protein